MLPFLSQPAIAPACYVPTTPIAQSQLFKGGQYLSCAMTAAPDLTKATINLWLNPKEATGAYSSIHRTYRDSSPGAGRKVFFSMITADGSLTIAEHGQEDNPPIYFNLIPNRKFRDVNGYLNLHIEMDSTLPVVADRVKIYINKVRETSFSTAAYLEQANFQTSLCLATTHYLGRYWDQIAQGNVYGFSGLMAMDYLIRGRALPPDAFVEMNIHGECVPKPFAAGFTASDTLLTFSNPLAPGNDSSGNAKHWTPSGFDATGKDTVASSPTNVFGTWNALDKGANVTVSDGGLAVRSTSDHGVRGTMWVSTGKWYWTATLTEGTYQILGVTKADEVLTDQNLSKGWGWRGTAGAPLLYAVGTNTATAYTWAVGDVISFALDLDAGKLWIGKNGVWMGGGDPALGTIPLFSGVTGPVTPYFENAATPYADAVTANFGQRTFAYAAPNGFTTLCTDNLAEPTVKDPAEGYADEVGTGANILALLDASTAHWNGAAYVEIIKRRDAAEDWRWRFSDDPTQAWATNNPNAKAVAPALVAGGSYVGHRLRVGKDYGVYTAEVAHVTGTPTTVTHGLATARNAVIATRVSVGGGDRYFRHPDMTAGHLMIFNGLSGSADNSSLTAFGATSFQIGTSAPSGTYRVLVLAERPGLLALPTFTGNGSADGAFSAADILPLWLWMFKSTSTGGRRMWDAARSPVNPASIHSAFNDSAIEGVTYPVDFVAGGVKARTVDNAVNGSGDKYHLVMWGRPVGGVCVAPATAR